MSNPTNLINTLIISSEWDRFWSELPGTITSGQMQKPVLVLTTPYQPGSQEEVQLRNMMQACELTENNHTLIQIPDKEFIAWHKIKQNINPNRIIMLGILPANLGIGAMFRLNEPNRFDDCIWIPALSLSEMERQPEMKADLWKKGLKPVFKEKLFGAI